MDPRRLPLLLLLILLPVPVRADRHTVECFGGASPEKKQSLSVRVSCGVRVKSDPASPLPSPTPPPPPLQSGQQVPHPITDLGNGTAASSATGNTGATPAKKDGLPELKRSVFLVAEAAEYIAGNDSGKRLDGWMVGPRLVFSGPSTIEPFVHGLVGRQRPARPNPLTAENDAATDAAWIAAVGFGFDFEFYPPEPDKEAPAVVPVLRVQFDAVKHWNSADSDPYGRVTFGVSFRFEGSHR